MLQFSSSRASFSVQRADPSVSIGVCVCLGAGGDRDVLSIPEVHCGTVQLWLHWNKKSVKDRSRSVDRTPQRADPLTIPTELAGGEEERRSTTPLQRSPACPNQVILAGPISHRWNRWNRVHRWISVQHNWHTWHWLRGQWPMVIVGWNWFFSHGDTRVFHSRDTANLHSDPTRHGMCTMCTVQSDNELLAYKKSDRDLRVNLERPEGHGEKWKWRIDRGMRMQG